MSGIFAAVLLITMFAWIAGLINPKAVMRWGQVKTRGRLSIICTLLMITSITLIGIFAEPEDTTGPEHTVGASNHYSSDNLTAPTTIEENITSAEHDEYNQLIESPSSIVSNEETAVSPDADDHSDRFGTSGDGPSFIYKDGDGVISSSATEQSDANGEMIVHYIDVGQGDATLLQGPDFTVLIDAGRHDRNEVVPYLRQVGVEQLDLVIGTHPHADHIGQLDKVINTFPVTEVWMSGDSHTSRTFERVLDVIIDSDANYVEPRTGETYRIGALQLTVVNPPDLSGGLNDNSIAIRVQYGEITFLFTGDAEQTNELKMVRSGEQLQAQILHLGHHGSSTSNTQQFLDKVQPDIAIYSAGIDNSYGHPHDEVIQRLTEMKITIYGTDVHGTIQVITDGSSYKIDTTNTSTIATSLPESSTVQSHRPADKPPTTVETPHSPIVGDQCGDEQVNINTATLEELKKIKHIGDVRAKALIALRPFESVADLTRISGIAASRLSDIVEEGIACAE